MIVAAKLRLDPDCMCLDFEKSFANAGKDQFPDALIVVCFSALEASNPQTHDEFVHE